MDHNQTRFPEYSIPKDMYAKEWTDGIETEKLEQQIERTKSDAVHSFFGQLGENLPTAPHIETACREMSKVLRHQVASDEWLETLNRGMPLNPQDKVYLTVHTDSLLPPVIVPEPLTVQATLRTIPLCVNAALGAGCGFFLGGMLARLVTIPAESGMIVGAPLGAFLLIWLSLFVVNNPKIRRWLLAIIGAGAAVDTALQVAKEMIPLPFGKSRFGFLRRLLGYVVFAWVIWLLKPKPSYAPTHYRQEVETIVEQWLRTSVSVIVVLMYRVRQGNDALSSETAQMKKEMDRVTKNMVGLAEVTAKINRRPRDGRDNLFFELVQMFKNLGFEIPDAATENESDFIWEETSGERFEMFGVVKLGDQVCVEEHPVMQNGTIVKKGLVRRIRM